MSAHSIFSRLVLMTSTVLFAYTVAALLLIQSCHHTFRQHLHLALFTSVLGIICGWLKPNRGRCITTAYVIALTVTHMYVLIQLHDLSHKFAGQCMTAATTPIVRRGIMLVSTGSQEALVAFAQKEGEIVDMDQALQCQHELYQRVMLTGTIFSVIIFSLISCAVGLLVSKKDKNQQKSKQSACYSKVSAIEDGEQCGEDVCFVEEFYQETVRKGEKENILDM
jgi:hypothetical protein